MDVLGMKLLPCMDGIYSKKQIRVFLLVIWFYSFLHKNPTLQIRIRVIVRW